MAAVLDENRTLDLTKLIEGLQKHLPSYAVPLFVRILSHVEMTGKNYLASVAFHFRGLR